MNIPSKVKTVDLMVVFAMVVLFILAFYQPLRWLVEAWVGDPYYSHGFLIPLIAIFLVWRLWGKVGGIPVCPSLWGLVLTTGALIVAVIGIINQAYFVASLAMPVFLAAVILFTRGWKTTWLLLFPLAYLILMIPMPFVNPMAVQLQVLTSMMAAKVAALVAVPVEQVGASLSVPGASFVVGIACSGLSSMVALLSLGLLLVYWVDGSLWSKIVLVLALVPIAIVSNTVRVGSLLWVAFHFGSEAGIFYHDNIAGFLSWGLALIFLVLGCKVLRCQITLAGSS